jgi:hypothetical protein
MTKQEKHELRLKLSKQLKQVQATLIFADESDLVNLEAKLKELLQKLAK